MIRSMAEPESPEELLPAVDDRLVMPGARAEIVRGALHMPPPADEPHGTSHFDLTYVLGAHVAEGFRGAVDMLTRTSRDSDFAPDASVFPAEREPRTGGRRLEELAFEIVSEQAIGVPTDKARELARRGVRRIYCVVLKKQRVLEWSRETDGWQMLASDAVIDDRCLARPLPVRALLDAAEADRAVVAALHARGLLAEIERTSREVGREEGREEGRAAGLRIAVRALCSVLSIELAGERAATLDGLEAQELEHLLAQLQRERRWPPSS